MSMFRLEPTGLRTRRNFCSGPGRFSGFPDGPRMQEEAYSSYGELYRMQKHTQAYMQQTKKEKEMKAHSLSRCEGMKVAADSRAERVGKGRGERTREGVEHSTPPTLVSMETTTLGRVIMQFPLLPS